MAGIKAFLQLEDKMTPQLSKSEKQAMANVKAYGNLKTEIDTLTKQLKLAEDLGAKNTDVYRRMEQQIESLAKQTAEYEDNVRQANQEEQQTDDSNKKLIGSITDVNQALELSSKAWGAVTSAIQKAREYMNMYFEQFNAEYTSGTKFRGLGASDAEIQSMYDYASALQKAGTIGDEVTLSGMSTLAMYAENTDQIKQLTPAILDLAVAQKGLKASESDVTSMAQKVGYALNGNATMLKRLIGAEDSQIEYLNSLENKTEKAAYLYQILEEKVGGANEALSNTAEGGVKKAENSLGDLGETLGSSVTPYFEAFERLLVQALTPAVQFLTDHMNVLAPIFLTLAAAIGVATVAMSIYALVTSEAAIATITATWPLFVILAVIVLIIGVVYGYVGAINEAEGTTYSALGIMMGLFWMFVNNVYNSVIVYLQNVFANFVNFLANVFNDPINTIIINFQTMAYTIVGFLNSIAQTIDFVFGSNLSSTVSSWMNDIKGERDKLIQESGYNEVIELWERVDPSQAFMDAYNIGAEFDASIIDLGNTISKISDFELLGTDFDLDNLVGTDGSGGKALKTTTNDKLLSDEDIQLLLDVATRDYKLNYQQVTPNITLTFGDIRETADIDDVLDKLADRLEEIVDGNLEVATNG